MKNKKILENFYMRKLMYLKLFVITLFCVIPISESQYTSVVQTESGPVRGKILKTVLQGLSYSAFKGIPYGEPPVGNLRFQAPVKKEKWTKVFNAVDEATPCIQFDVLYMQTRGKEDCLYLNVYTPVTEFNDQKEPKAVMVFIHGGAFFFGEGKQSLYGPDHFIDHDVILVTFNYRLMFFGFLNLNHEHSSSNVALRDQNLAMKWVKENIVHFGGDPNRITLFGQSAGADSTDYHVLAEKSAGLFNQSISLSGSPLCYSWTYQPQIEAVFRAFALGRALGFKTKSKEELVKQLQTVPAEKIVSISARNQWLVSAFRPMIENATTSKDPFITKCSIDKYLSGEYNKGPHMMGYTSNEAKGFLPGINKMPSLAKRAIQPYLKYVSDLMFETGIDAKQQLMIKHNNHPIYMYRFAYDPSRNDPLGVGHIDDIYYLFHSSLFFLKMDLRNPHIKNSLLRHIRMFTNFAKYGHPTPNGEQDPLLKINWPSSGPEGLMLDIDKNMNVKKRSLNKLVTSLESIGFSLLRIMHDCE